MIKFFRRIRQQLLSQNKFSKYLFYAIGEIVLVMVGILLALQVNNWNVERKGEILERKILNEIKSNLGSTLLSFTRTIETEEIYMEYNLLIKDYLDNSKPYTTLLDEAFGMYFWTISSHPVTVGYDYLKSRGLEFISNDSLRIEISLIFENDIPIIQRENEVWANNLQQNISYPYHVEHFLKYFPDKEKSNNLEYAKPNNYGALIDNVVFKSINTEIISNRKWNINSLENLISNIENIVEHIDLEIEYLSK